MELLRETTTPEQREAGVRRIVVALGADHSIQVEVNVTQMRDMARSDEPVMLQATDELVSNHNLAIALIRIAAASVTRVGNKL